MADQVYIGLGDETDPDEIVVDATEYVQIYFPDWEPAEANLDYIQIKAFAQEAAIERTLAGETADEIFRFFGTLVGITAQDPTPATCLSTWTAVDDTGYDIDEGTQVTLDGADGTPISFQVVSTVTIAPGDTSTGTDEVELEAIDSGVDGNDLSGTVTLVDQLAYIDSATVATPSSGGSDGETDAEYLLRLAQLLRLQAPRPILPADFADFARTSVEGVARATAIDLYNADTLATDEPRCVTVAVVDVDGEACSTEIKDEVDALLQANREVNFLTFVIDPTYTTVDCWFTFEAKADYDAAEVETNAITTVTDYLSPANWGLPDTTGSDTTSWDNQTTIRINELISLIDQVDGVDYVTGVWLDLEGGPGDTVDLDIDGPVAMPRAGTILAEAP